MKNKYDQLFDEHMERAKNQFIERNKREPTIYELLAEFDRMMHYFYDVNASFLIFAALLSPYFSLSFLR